jgi:hypothetical protein
MATDCQKRWGLVSAASHDNQATGQVKRLIHSTSSVVFPDPAGAGSGTTRTR